jgi:hypothetical protein
MQEGKFRVCVQITHADQATPQLSAVEFACSACAGPGPAQRVMLCCAGPVPTAVGGVPGLPATSRTVAVPG